MLHGWARGALWLGMERLVFYGKGGIGKSTLSANIAAILARRGKRVLHVGCDPKHDSTVALMAGEMIPTVTDRRFGAVVHVDDIISRSRSGVDCVEAGGPEAGVGCAGRGISRTLEIFDKAQLLSPERYDVVTFDLLGDVVCGGFAAPLRHEVGEKVVIVSSEEVMSLYAANNIAKAVVTYAKNGVVCAGILLNRRDPGSDLGPVERFAGLLGTRILGVIERDPLIREAEYARLTLAEHTPEAPLVQQLAGIADEILALDPALCPTPSPLSDRDFYARARDRFAGVAATRERPAGSGDEAASGDRSLGRETTADQSAATGRGGGNGNEVLRRQFKRDLRAGIVAVRDGLVDAEDAAARLRESYPELTRTLSARDLQSR